MHGRDAGGTTGPVDPIVAESAVPGESIRLDAGEVSLHALRAGPEDGPLVVLLHGFPEFWYGWHRQVRPLVDAGFRVLVPDQRGYNRSAKPEPVRAYRLDRLAADVVGLLDAVGRERAHLVGHDWGAAVAWWTALHHPDRLNRLVAVNVPHPSVVYRRLRDDWEQRLRLAYILPFQVPVLPEAIARTGNWAPLVWTMRRTGNPGTFSTVDFERYRRAWSRPRAFTAMLNWYRAAGRSRPRPASERVEVPTTVLWGADDQALKPEMARESVAQCRDGRLKLVEGATHWIQHEKPQFVAEALIEFLGA